LGESSPSETPTLGTPPAGLVIARVTAADANALASLFGRNRGTPASETFDPFELTAARARLIAGSVSRDPYFLARLGREAVAFSMLRGFDEGYAIPSLGVLVDGRHQGRGIGRWLTERTIAAARELGAPAVRLTVYASNAVGVGLYRSLGFVERERSRIERHGAPDEKLVMELPLGGVG